MRKILLFCFLVIIALPCLAASTSHTLYTKGFETPYYKIVLFPQPAILGQEVRINLATSLEAEKITLEFSNGDKIALEKEGKIWQGSYVVPTNLATGEYTAYLYIRYWAANPNPPGFWNRILGTLKLRDLREKRWITAQIPYSVINPQKLLQNYYLKLNPTAVSLEFEARLPYKPDQATLVLNIEDRPQFYPCVKLSGETESLWKGSAPLPKDLNPGPQTASFYVRYFKQNRSLHPKILSANVLNFYQKFFDEVEVINFPYSVYVKGKLKYEVTRAERRVTNDAIRDTNNELRDTRYEQRDTIPEGIPIPYITVSGEVIPAFEEIKTLEAISTPEAPPIKITGNKVLTFRSKSLEGSREGFEAGTSREESLRLNVAGELLPEVSINADILSTSTTTQREDKLSIALKSRDTELYIGDFTADLTGTEFCSLNRPLSGVKVSGNYPRFGFKAIASSPAGQAKNIKMYGNRTQGPYALGSAPVVVDSEKVYVDGVRQRRGDDYEIDYQAGTLTFRQRIIEEVSIINIDYDWRETIYARRLYALRTEGQVLDNLKLGATYINDSDSRSGAESIRAALAAPIDPVSHYVMGADGQIEIAGFKLAGEAAYSEKNPNLLSSTSEVQFGRAAKVDVSGAFAGLNLAARAKRVSSAFLPVGNAAPRQDVWAHGGSLGWAAADLIFINGDYQKEEYTQSGARYKTFLANGKFMLTPAALPNLSYVFRQEDTSNDPVGQQFIERMNIRNSAEISHTLGAISSRLLVAQERRIDQQPSYSELKYKIAQVGISTLNLENIQVNANAELKEINNTSAADSIRKTYDLNLALTPSKDYLVSGKVNIIDDSLEGPTNITDLSYKASPSSLFKTEGKFTISSVKENATGTAEAVSKNVGSLRLTLRPAEFFGIDYIYRPNFTLARRTNTFTYSNFTHQTEVQVLPSGLVSTSLIYKTNTTANADRSDPALTREQTRNTSSQTSLIFRAAPLRLLSTELRYSVEDTRDLRLVSAEALTYDQTLGLRKKIEAAVKTSLNESLALDTSYNIDTTNQTGPSSSSNNQSQTGSCKVLWDMNQNLTATLTAAFSKTLDFGSASESTSFAPAAGLIYRLEKYLRVDAEYSSSQSFAGTSTRKDKLTFQTKYDMNQWIHFTLRGEQEVSFNPNYKTMDVMGTLEIIL